MKRSFAPLVVTLVVCLFSAMLLSAAEPTAVPKAQVQVQKPPTPVALSNVQIVSAKFSCGNPSSANFVATVKNTGTKSAGFVGTLKTTKPGACIKTDPTKNPDGTPCKPDQMLCPGYCTQYAPDTSAAATIGPITIAAGATGTFSKSIPNLPIKSGTFSAVEQGQTKGATKMLGAFTPCVC